MPLRDHVGLPSLTHLEHVNHLVQKVHLVYVSCLERCRRAKDGLQ